jgi:hypothetical protein
MDVRQRSSSGAGPGPGTFLMALAAGIASLGNRVDAEQPPFAHGAPVEVGPGSGEIFLADIDGDGHLDLVTKHLLQRRLVVFAGDGRGQFAPLAGASVDFGFQPGAVTLGDVDGDVDLDLIVAWKDPANEYVEVRINDGVGSYRSVGARVITGASFAFYKPSVRVMDINGDRRPDIVAANGRRNRIDVLLGDGGGAFALGPGLTLPAGYDRYSSALADVDGDGHADLATAMSGATGTAGGRDVIALLVGDGRGGFRDTTITMPPTLPEPRLLALVDINGDQRNDLVLGHGDQGRVSVVLNLGQGRFSHAPGSPYAIPDEGFAVTAADVNRDGRPDLLAATVTAVSVLLGDGRTFDPAFGSPVPAGPGAYHLAVGDIDRDGKLDVAASSFEGDRVTILLGR